MNMTIEFEGNEVEVEIEVDSLSGGEPAITSGPADNWSAGDSASADFRVFLDGVDITDELSDRQLEMIEESLLEDMASDAADRRGEEREENERPYNERYL